MYGFSCSFPLVFMCSISVFLLCLFTMTNQLDEPVDSAGSPPYHCCNASLCSFSLCSVFMANKLWYDTVAFLHNCSLT